MNLKKYTDYALRVLIYTGMKGEGELASIGEISDAFSISDHHLRKIVVELNKMDLLHTVRGRQGGIRLAVAPEKVNIGATVRRLEGGTALVECFNRDGNHCIISPACNLKHVFHEALEAFFQVLDKYTLEDLIENDRQLRELMGIRL